MTAPTDALIERLRGLLAKATPGPWYHYDEVFRPQFGRRRVTEIQRDRDGKAIISWGGFDGLDPVMARKKNANAALIVEAINALPELLAERKSLLARIEAAEKALEPFVKIPLCYPRHKSRPQPAQLDTPAPANAYSAADVERARRLLS